MIKHKNNESSDPLDIIENITDGIWEWQIDTNKSYFSPRWKDKLG